MTLATSNIALPDDGDYVETCWSCFNVNFITLLKQFSCASVGKKKIDNIKVHGRSVRIVTFFSIPYYCFQQACKRHDFADLSSTVHCVLKRAYYMLMSISENISLLINLHKREEIEQTFL